MVYKSTSLKINLRLYPKNNGKTKMGFSIPLEKWLKNELNYLITKYLNEDSLTKTNFK